MPGNRGNVLVVDDTADTAALLVDLIEQEGFQATVCSNAAEALAAYDSIRPLIVLLDWGLPDRPGIEVCRDLRRLDARALIIFISGRNDEASIARAFEAGGDDFVVKPIRPGELMARIEAHLRRLAIPAPPPVAVPDGAAGGVVRFGPIQLDMQAREVRSAGEIVRLSALEYKLLEYLVVNAGIAVSRDQILNNVYGYDADITSERVDLLVRRLRSKLGENERGGHLVTVTGYGYRFDRRAG